MEFKSMLALIFTDIRRDMDCGSFISHLRGAACSTLSIGNQTAVLCIDARLSDDTSPKRFEKNFTHAKNLRSEMSIINEACKWRRTD